MSPVPGSVTKMPCVQSMSSPVSKVWCSNASGAGSMSATPGWGVGDGVAIAVGVAFGVGDGVAVAVGVGSGVGDGVAVAVGVAFGVGDGVAADVGSGVGVAV